MTEIEQSIEFIKEIDALKSVIRKSLLISRERYENTAEHSWHSAMMVLVMAKHANESIDLLKALKMMLIHDIVEIDAGDTFCYAEDQSGKFETEQKAAQRIFGMLPSPLDKELLDLWLEFETQNTPEALFCRACDRLIPLIHNANTEGQTWQENGVTEDKVRRRNRPIEDGSKPLWEYTDQLIAKAVKNNHLPA